MKKIILLLTVLIPFIVNAMKIEKDEIDEFTGCRTVVTSWEALDKGRIHIRFRHQNDYNFVDLKFLYDGAIVITESDKLMLKSTTDEIAKFTPTGTFTGTKGGGAVGLSGSAAWGIFASYYGSVDWFTDNVIRLMRINSSDTYIDKNISEKDGYQVKKLASLYMSTVNGDEPVKLVTCTLTYVKKTKKKSSWETVKEEYLKDALPDEMMGKINEWRSQTDDKYDYDVMIEKKK